MYGNHLHPPPNRNNRRKKAGDDELQTDPMWESNNNDSAPGIEFLYKDMNVESENQMPEVDDLEDLDKLVGAEVILPQNGTDMKSGKVIGRVTDRKGRPIGTYNNDPLLDTRVYEVEFSDGTIQQYSVNLIVE